LEQLISIAIYSFVMTITPGPNNIMIMASGLNFGIKKSIPHLLGIAFGFPLMLVLVGYGLIELINSSRYLYYSIKVFSFTYLAYLAYRMATTGDIKSGSVGSKPLSFFQSFFFQWANPKAWIMIVGGVGIFVSEQNIDSAYLVLAFAFFLMIFICNGAWLFMGSKLQKIIKNKNQVMWFNRIMAALLLLSVLPAV
jgi:threonine/homoserine/homoserine lactone efflux protein